MVQGGRMRLVEASQEDQQALNAKTGMKSSAPRSQLQEVKDPGDIAALNKGAGIDDSQNMFEKVYNKLGDIHKAFGEAGRKVGLPPELGDLYQALSQKGGPLQYNKESLSNLAMFAGPEIKLATGGREAINSASQIAKNIAGNMGRVGLSTAAGTKIQGGDNADAALAGLYGAGASAVLAPLGFAVGSKNPYMRIPAAATIGGLGGYGLGQMTGLPFMSAAGTVVGSLLGGRGGMIPELAAREVANKVTPDQLAAAQVKQQASDRMGIKTTATEQVGGSNQDLQHMQMQAAGNRLGGQVVSPIAQARPAQTESYWNKFLNSISPKNAKNTIEDQAYKHAFTSANERGTKFDAQPLVAKIDEEMKAHNPNSPTYKALEQVKSLFGVTERTATAKKSLVAPYEEKRAQWKAHEQKLQQTVDELKANAPDPYFAASSGHTEKLAEAERQLQNVKNLGAEMDTRLDQFKQHHGIDNPYESTLEGLHNVKMGISGIIDSRNSGTSIGRTAAGVVKQVNKELTNMLKSQSPEYAQASRIADLRMVRTNLEDAMQKSPITGSNIYDKVLSNRNEFNKLYKRLADPSNPHVTTTAQRAMLDMRTVFPDMLDNISGKASSEAPKIAEGWSTVVKGVLNKVFMDRYHQAVMELMVNPKWQEELHRVSKLPSGEERGLAAGRLLARIAATSGADIGMQMKQGSDDDGSFN
jgi:hypothetical protein